MNEDQTSGRGVAAQQPAEAPPNLEAQVYAFEALWALKTTGAGKRLMDSDMKLWARGIFNAGLALLDPWVVRAQPPASPAPSAQDTSDEGQARALVRTLVDASCRQERDPSERHQNEYCAAKDAVIATLLAAPPQPPVAEPVDPRVVMTIEGPFDAAMVAEQNLRESLSGWKIIREHSDGKAGRHEVRAVFVDKPRPFTALDRWGKHWRPPAQPPVAEPPEIAKWRAFAQHCQRTVAAIKSKMSAEQCIEWLGEEIDRKIERLASSDGSDIDPDLLAYVEGLLGDGPVAEPSADAVREALAELVAIQDEMPAAKDEMRVSRRSTDQHEVQKFHAHWDARIKAARAAARAALAASPKDQT